MTFIRIKDALDICPLPIQLMILLPLESNGKGYHIPAHLCWRGKENIIIKQDKKGAITKKKTRSQILYI